MEYDPRSEDVKFKIRWRKPAKTFHKVFVSFWYLRTSTENVTGWHCCGALAMDTFVFQALKRQFPAHSFEEII